MSNIGKIIRVNALPPVEERENNTIYQVAEPGSATYTDYAVDENGDIKTHAGYFDPQDLTENSVNISTQELLDEGLVTQKDFNIKIREKVGNKIEKPIINGTPQSYPKIVGLDAYGNTAALHASDLGKNIANSLLTSVAGSGLTLGTDWAVQTAGHPYSILGLKDVSADSAFRTFISQNDSGELGKTNGIQPFLSLPSTLSESEKTAWKTAMNGGWTTNTMSVAITYPQFIKYGDIGEKFITVLGANLNLNPASFKIEILDSNDTVIKIIDNSKVSLIDTNRLNFWDNTFHTLPVGIYKLRIWNGVAYYVYPTVFEVKDTIQTVDISGNTWTTKTYDDKVYTGISSTLNTVSIGSDSFFWSNMPNGRSEAMVTATSSSFLTNHDNFIVDFYISNSALSVSIIKHYAIGLTDVESSLFNDMPVFLGMRDSNSDIDFAQASGGGNIVIPKNTEAKMMVIKQGSNITMILSYNATNIVSYATIDTTVQKPLYFKVFHPKNDTANQSGTYTYRIGNIIKLN